MGVYLGHSPRHASNVALVLNITTGHVSPQYHLIFDDDFSTVGSMRIGKVPTNWDRLVEKQRELATTEQFTLQEEWRDQQADAYPQSALNIMQWTTEDEPISEQSRTRPNEGDAIANEGDMIANESDVIANEGECSPATQPAAALTNDNNCELCNQQIGPTESPENLFLPPAIDLTTAGLRRSGRTPKPSQRMNLMAWLKGAACFLAQWMDQQLLIRLLSLPQHLTLRCSTSKKPCVNPIETNSFWPWSRR